MRQSPTSVRVLLLADSHLGFDLPLNPRVYRRRRGYDFLANHERALAAAREEQVDLVVHGGDVFHRSRVPTSLVYQAFKALLEIADEGTPVFVVPGNHERSRIPHCRLGHHPNLHIFHVPSTIKVEVRGTRVALSGFPYQRRGIRELFPKILQETGWRNEPVDIRLLCVHHCVEGATVGPGNHTFRDAPDVIRCADLPTEFAAVLSGHVHRRQVLQTNLRGRPLPTPVFYPGSMERTAFAEMGEQKGFLVIDVEPDAMGGRVDRHRFVNLPTRPMEVRDLAPSRGSDGEWHPGELQTHISRTLDAVPEDAVVRIRVHGPVSQDGRLTVTAARLRGMTPPGMNLEVILVDDPRPRRRDRHSGASPPGSGPSSRPSSRRPSTQISLFQ